MPQSLKQLCIHHGIPLMCRFQFIGPDDVMLGTHTVYLDPERVKVTTKDGRPCDVFGIGFDENEGFADLVTSLRACMRAGNLVMRLCGTGGITELELAPDLTV